jgi:nifR3 family TIM-barrel protein
VADSLAQFRELLTKRPPVVLAPMEDVSDAVFRRLCRSLGADLCVTEFVNVEGLLRGCKTARRKITLEPGDTPTAIQIYGSDPERLAEAARVAEAAQPSYLDINCGCWVPKIAGRGAGAGWLRDPPAMVAMASLIVKNVALPVTVKTRIGYGPESHMPIVDLARRLEDVGVAALTIHCRTASMGHSGAADWAWAARARAAVSIPVLVNGDVRTAEDAARALTETGCEGVMVGRAAIDHPWVFREARALLDRGETIAAPTSDERFDLCRLHLLANVEGRGEPHGVRVTRRHLTGYLRGLTGAAALRRSLLFCDSLAGCLDLLEAARESLRRTGSADPSATRPPSPAAAASFALAGRRVPAAGLVRVRAPTPPGRARAPGGAGAFVILGAHDRPPPDALVVSIGACPRRPRRPSGLPARRGALARHDHGHRAFGLVSATARRPAQRRRAARDRT